MVLALRTSPLTNRKMCIRDRGKLVLCTDDLPRSAVVTNQAVYLSPFSTATLLRRLETHSIEGSTNPMEVPR